MITCLLNSYNSGDEDGPKVHLTKSPFNRKPFDRKFILPKTKIFFDIFSRKFQNFPEELLSEFQKSKSEYVD
jgi:hypothetical protein